MEVGDTIVWTQQHQTTHTTTSGTPGNLDGIWDSEFLNNGQTFSFTFTEAGTFPYFCTIHPSMRATVTVTEGDSAAPSPTATPTPMPTPSATPTPRATAAPATTVRLFIPSDDNLQLMNLWIALGAGHFEEQGLDVQIVLPPAEGGGGGTPPLLGAPADVAVMARPRYLRLIGQEEPLLVFANLLENDPINLVVRREVAEERGLSADMPLAKRLNAIRGLKGGVAPGPPVRLRVLFESVGLDADSDIEMVIIPGDEQNKAYEEGLVDALYAHTPFLERALVEQGAVMIVNQSAGEVPELGPGLQHALVTTREYANANPEVLVALVKALHRAQQLVHADLQAAADAIRGSGVNLLAPRGLETIVAIYEPAIPQTPEVSVEAVLKELALFPAHQTPPDLSGIDLTKYVEPRFAQQAISESPPTPSATAAVTPTAIATPMPTASPTATTTTPPPIQGEITQATIQNFRHQDLTVQVGDTIVWTQQDQTTHTTTSGTPGNLDGIWDSEFLNNGQTFSFTFTEAGAFPYYCTIHPSMTATVTVTEAGSSDSCSSPPEATPGSSGDGSGGGDIEY